MSSSRRIASLLLAAMLCSAAPSYAFAEDTGIIVLVGRSPPSVRWEDGKLTGYWVELSRLIAAHAGVPLADIESIPYARALREVAEGSNVCHPFVTRTPDREARYRWIAPTRRVVISVFTRAGATDPPRSVDALKQREIAVQRDTFGDATLQAMAIPALRVSDT